MIISQHVWLAFLWLGYGVVHSLLAAEKIKSFIKNISSSLHKYYRLLYSVFAAATLGGVLYYHIFISSIALWNESSALKIIAVLLALPALVIMIVSIKKYFFYLSGIDVLFKKQAAPLLQTNGLNKYMRHPLYTGTLLLVWCIFLYMPLLKNLIGCFCITAYTIAGAYFEEKKLLREFGDAYKNYAAKVPMLFPKFF
ncbi:MAG TPA: isoprenylcysteine carboxylmethyltransferase family protein [Chitinophagaceae bacterium]|nr:isoprenylcysteine carboxylmethyltransferase family protein [Chitinophagaceae bacterium]